MRKLILKMSMSLDGFVGRPNGDVSWIFPTLDAGATAWIVDTLWQAGVHVMGSVTYRDMAGHWPSSTEPYAPPMNEIPKIVFSKTLKEAAWTDSRVAGADVGDEIARLKREPGKGILAHGGARFVQTLVRRGLIDEYRLVVHPVVLGTGLRLFPERDRPMNLHLVSTTRFDEGAVAHVYRPE